MSRVGSLGAPGRRNATAPLGALMVFLVASTAQATVLMDWSLGDLVARSDLIVIGTVVEANTVETKNLPMTVTTIAVDSSLLGEATPRIEIWQMGGRRGSSVSRVVGDAQLIVGSRVLLFTRRHHDGRRYLVGMSLGAYRVHGTALAQEITAPLLREGQLTAPPGERALQLRDVVDAISKGVR